MRIKTVIVATDFSEVSLRAVETAFSLDIEEGGVLYLLHVLEGPVDRQAITRKGRPGITQAHRAAMNGLQDLVPQNWDRNVRIQPEVETGEPAEEIVDLAVRTDADIIVVGTHGRKGLQRVLVGSTAEHLLRDAPCQVLVVK